MSPVEFMNAYVQVPWFTVLAIVGVLLAFVGVFTVTAFYALNKPFLSDMPESSRPYDLSNGMDELRGSNPTPGFQLRRRTRITLNWCAHTRV